MPAFPEFNPILRLPEVRASRDELEALLGVVLSRYEPYRKRPGTYAQLNLPMTEKWEQVIGDMQRVGPALKLAVQRGWIATPMLDVGMILHENCFHRGLIFPAALCEALGRHGVALEVSVYPIWGKRDRFPMLRAD